MASAEAAIKIDRRYEVEFRLRERERFLRTLIGNLPGVVYRCRTDEKFTSEFISDGCTELTGYTADEITRERTASWDDIIHPDDRERVRREVNCSISNTAAVLANPQMQTVYRIITRAKAIKHVRDRFRFIIDTNGKVIALEGFIADITERTLAEERVRESESRYRLLAENMRDLVCLHDRDGKFVYVSPSSPALLGYEPAELIGKSPYDLMHPEEVSCVRDETHARLLEGETNLTLDYRIRKKSGEYVWLESMASTICNETGELTQLLTVSRDISKRKAAEQERAQAQEEIAALFMSEQELRQDAEAAHREAEHANRIKDEFLQMVSHEFRTPLTTIKTLARVMQNDGDSEEERQEYLETIAAECDRQIDMILNLLDVARIEAGKVDLQSEPVDINRLLRSCDKIERHAAHQRKQTFNVMYDSGLPLVRGDEKALRRAVCAIIENAIKYTPDGGMINIIARRVERAAKLDDRSESELRISAAIAGNLDQTKTVGESDKAVIEMVAIVVCDTGRGIHPDDVPQLFQKFFRGRRQVPHDASTDGTFDDAMGRAETPGVGLGLYLTKRLIDELGGSLAVQSEIGRGTCFSIFLPVWDPAQHVLDNVDEYDFDERIMG